MAKIGSSLPVEDDDAAVPVAIGDEDLVVLGVHPDAGGAPEKFPVIAPRVLVVAADRHEVVAGARELHDAVMTVAAHPDVVVVIDEDAVCVAGEFGHVLRGGVAPALDHVALGIELDDHGGRHAAGPDRRVLHRGDLFGCQRLGQVGDPDVVLRVDEHAGDRPHDPQVGHLAGPAGIDRERRSTPPASPDAANRRVIGIPRARTCGQARTQAAPAIPHTAADPRPVPPL